MLCSNMNAKFFKIFQLFLTPDNIEFITDYSNLYVTRDKNEPNFNVDMGEISRFIGLFLISLPK